MEQKAWAWCDISKVARFELGPDASFETPEPAVLKEVRPQQSPPATICVERGRHIRGTGPRNLPGTSGEGSPRSNA
eukprot:16439891-Heterocapsa_arctica.AAC.3